MALAGLAYYTMTLQNQLAILTIHLDPGKSCKLFRGVGTEGGGGCRGHALPRFWQFITRMILPPTILDLELLLQGPRGLSAPFEMALIAWSVFMYQI